MYYIQKLSSYEMTRPAVCCIWKPLQAVKLVVASIEAQKIEQASSCLSAKVII